MIALSKLITVCRFSPSTSGVCPGKFTQTVNHSLYGLWPYRQTAGQLVITFFRGTNLVDIGFRLAKNDTVNQCFGFFDNARCVQQRF